MPSAAACAKLAGEGGQVLVVTHSPQVAALGAHHWRVEKAVTKGETFSRVTQLSAEARVDEIARMLAGDTVTEAARAAARALIAAEVARGQQVFDIRCNFDYASGQARIMTL
jgi:DNA repair ATPase RecN